MSVEQARFEKLGTLVMGVVPSNVQRAFLYAELDDGVVAPSLYYELGSDLFYVEPDDELFDELFRLQEKFGLDVKVLEFEINGSKFNADFSYADRFDSASDKPTRTKAALRRRFGRDSVRY